MKPIWLAAGPLLTAMAIFTWLAFLWRVFGRAWWLGGVLSIVLTSLGCGVGMWWADRRLR